jgi:hypothetical protein
MHFRPANYQELFNLRHSSLRNAIERIFGVCKRRFKLMVVAPQYSISTQAKIPAALAALHNFIRIVDPDDDAQDGEDNEGSSSSAQSITHSNLMEVNQAHLGHFISQAEKIRADKQRDDIAKAMWNDYQRVLDEYEGEL